MLKSGEDLVPVTATRGTLIRLKGSTIEMLIWFILHEQRESGKIDYIACGSLFFYRNPTDRFSGILVQKALHAIIADIRIKSRRKRRIFSFGEMSPELFRGSQRENLSRILEMCFLPGLSG